MPELYVREDWEYWVVTPLGGYSKRPDRYAAVTYAKSIGGTVRRKRRVTVTDEEWEDVE